MRVIIVGSRSFIAQQLQRTAESEGVEAIGLRRDVNIATIPITADDVVVNCALHPAYRTGTYSEEVDLDLSAARAAHAAGARFIMLSTRRVYPQGARWGAREDNLDATGDETAYGKNKAQSEYAVRKLLNDSTAIFRLSNVFGFEYEPDTPRTSFFGQLARSLKLENAIRFDMSEDTRRDFIPVELVAKSLLAAARMNVSGIFNLGAGFPLRCGSIATWVQEGFGGGCVICERSDIRDEFFLDMQKWQARFGWLPVDQSQLQSYCVALGQRLQCAKS